MRPLPRLFALLFLVVSTALFAQSDVPVSTTTLANAPFDQTAASVASDGTNYLVAWRDTRSPLGGIYATRVDFRGLVLDQTGIRIGGSGDGQPEVVWSGSSYVIAWQETNFGPDGSGPHYSIRVARVGTNGALLEGPRTIREDAVGYARNVATNGSRIVIAYTLNSSSANPRVALAILDRDARTIAAEVPVSSPVTTGNFGATVRSNGSDFIAVWTSSTGAATSMVAAHIDPAGNVLASTTLAQALPPADGALVASDGTDFLVFTRALTSAGDELQAIRVAADLSIIHPAQPVGAPSGVTVEQPRVVFNNGTYFLVWTDPQAKVIRSLHLDRDGKALDQPGIAATWQTSGLVAYPNVASNGGGVLLVWNDSRFSADAANLNYDVMSRLVDQTILIANPERVVSISAPRQVDPQLAAGGGVTMAVWTEESGIYAARVTPAGALDGRGIQLSYSGFSPNIVFDGTNFLITFGLRTGDFVSIKSARIDLDGHVIDAHNVADVCATTMTLARGATSSLLAYANCTTGAIDAIRIAGSGEAIDSLPLTLTPPAMLAANPSAAWNGSEYLVAWEQLIPRASVLGFPTYYTNVRATRVSGSLTLIDGQPLAIAVSIDDRFNNDTPSVASNGEEFLITWNSPAGVAAIHVADSGLITDSAPLILGNGNGPDAVWDGVRYLVAWRDDGIIEAAHVGDAGDPLPSDRVAIVNTLLEFGGLDLVQTAPGRVTALYTRVDTSKEAGNVERAFVRPL
ncbi:MAG TPA: hypothetical protein VJ032_02490, partial [Thermoanaerobaculia bacterium]|nr:hypothetical protein [Thermoanaerobaculia bacterium]